jgi:hypothetical protein
MLVFSDQHPWQGNESVQQILVFSSPETKRIFEAEMIDRFNKTIAQNAYAGTDPSYETRVRNDLSDSNAGAMYKLRAVKNNKGMFVSIIRCGTSGVLLWEDYYEYNTPEIALRGCLNHLKISIMRTDTPSSLKEGLIQTEY